MICDDTTEVERLSKTVIVIGKINHLFQSTIWCVAIYVVPEYVLGWVSGSVFVFVKRHCTGVYIVKEG